MSKKNINNEFLKLEYDVCPKSKNVCKHISKAKTNLDRTQGKPTRKVVLNTGCKVTKYNDICIVREVFDAYRRILEDRDVAEKVLNMTDEEIPEICIYHKK